MGKNLVIFICSLIFLSVFLLLIPPEINAQCTSLNCDASSNFCSFGECCHCKCGPPLGVSSGGGPVVCCIPGTSNCSENFNTKCEACTGGGGGTPTNTPTPTPRPTNTPKPPSPKTWICVYPGGNVGYAYGYDICIESPFPCDPTKGGNCYSSLQDCLNACVLSKAQITPRPGLDVLCVPGWALGVFGINSAIGCIPASDTYFLLVFILRWTLGIGGGITLILIAYGGYLIIASRGDIEKVKNGKKVLTAAVSGLFLIVMAVYVLDLFGVRIFQIPGI